ncbi:MAG: hybrid sensor histidine kinase/response regulator [Pseudomonadota bacterium]|nr:hybrid sensor histidine kinase/response regulator [Pseudomonadota bacterium]
MNKSPLVLVVDDQNTNLQLIGEVLDQAGYQVMPSLSGEQALARAKLRQPDLVLLDMAMPGMDGIQTCRDLRTLPGMDQLPILFVTAVNDRASLVAAFAAGAVDYITKPFVVEELLVRVRTHMDLKHARDRLAKSVKEREDVVDIVAHDLKNPLTCVLFAAQALHRNPGSEQRRAELAGEIESCAEEAMQYIQRFLTRGNADQRLRQFGAEHINFGDIAREAARFMRASAEPRDVRLVVDGAADAWADARALRNVMQNLISNAIRHSPAGTDVTVELKPSPRPGWSLCMVKDCGSGVSAELQPRLFQRYARQVDSAGADNSDGNRFSSGLGLAIAKHDIVQMGGNLWYEPREEGGSIFIIELPQRSPDL